MRNNKFNSSDLIPLIRLLHQTPTPANHEREQRTELDDRDEADTDEQTQQSATIGDHLNHLNSRSL